MASGPDGYVYGLIWETKQSEIPQDAMLLKVSFVGGIENSWGFRARVLEGPEKMKGRVYRFLGERSSSCVGLGTTEGFLVVRKQLLEQATEKTGEKTKFFAAVEYEPSFFHEVQRVLGGRPWRWPGKTGPGPIPFPTGEPMG
ncbi:hypothetical protein [uncultured Erythrobacter sp.]|uniref:hypothetical protein n=1 Tax=uncultured Erythrobacter sp. TaxID=263913 RepID=UPI00262A758A|nr:hypothetical protein [uncultured Erythrobacter sp.]